MKKYILSGLTLVIVMIVIFRFPFQQSTPSKAKAITATLPTNKIEQAGNSAIPLNNQVTSPSPLPYGARIVSNPLEDFAKQSGYSNSAVKKFINFTGKDILLLAELSEEERLLVQQDLSDIDNNGYATVSDESSKEFYNLPNYVTNYDIPTEQLTFKNTDVTENLTSMNYDYVGVISPHQNTNSDAPWNSLIQIYRQGDSIISVDQGSLGQGGTAFITEGYDNVYLKNDYPASYLKNQSADGQSYYSLYFSSGQSVYQLKSSTDNKVALISLAENILKSAIMP